MNFDDLTEEQTMKELYKTGEIIFKRLLERYSDPMFAILTLSIARSVGYYAIKKIYDDSVLDKDDYQEMIFHMSNVLEKEKELFTETFSDKLKQRKK